MSRLIEPFAQFFDGAGNPLIKGYLLFLESGTVDTLKTTYYDSGENIANPNPLQLDAEGRCPNVFGTGTYKVISYTNDELLNQPSVQLQSFDPVGGQTGYAQWSDWDATTNYDQNDLVRGTDGSYYRSLFTSNINNNPVTEPSAWDLIGFYAPGATIPIGGIIMWSGAISAIPSGWFLCNGTLGTPDLTDRFVIHADADAAGTNNVGEKGGCNYIIADNLPMHKHNAGSLATDTEGDHTHNLIRTQGYTGAGAIVTATNGTHELVSDTKQVSAAGSHVHDVSGETGNGGLANDVFKPQYYALAYIMKG